MKSRILFFTPFIFLFSLYSHAAVDISTATGHTIRFDDATGIAHVEGNAHVVNSTADLKADMIELNTKESVGHAVGHVIVEESSSTLHGDEAHYYWVASTGLITGAMGVSPPWRFAGERMIQSGRGVFNLSEGDFTSCNADPPHFAFHSQRSNVVTGKRAKLYRTQLRVGDTPVFWTPFYTRSLKPKKYSLSIQPGQSGRDGIIVRTALGYPFSNNSYTKFKYDYFQLTGNGVGLNHQYNSPNIKGILDWYYIRDTNPDPQPQSRRYHIDMNHYQKIVPQLTMRAKFNLQSDQTFGNQFAANDSRGQVENQVRGILSEGGFSYQFSKATLETTFDRQDKFDATISSKSFVAKVTNPRLSLTTAPLRWKYFPIFTSFSGSYVSESLTRISPLQTLLFQKSANAGIQLQKDLKINKLSITPRLGYGETWQDRILDIKRPDATQDIYIGRYSAGIDFRRRYYRLVDVTIGGAYGARLKSNRLDIDKNADDNGVETRRLNGSIIGRMGRNSVLTFTGGYELRKAPRSNLSQYERRSSRIIAPSMDLQYQASKKVNFFYRETYLFFDPSAKKSVRTPANTSGEIQYGEPATKTFYSQGFNYTKPSGSDESVVNLATRVKQYLTPKWYLNLLISYRAVGKGNLNYRQFLPSEKMIEIVRDLHCWVLRANFSKRPDRDEISFYIDLKANLSKPKNVFNENKDDRFLSTPDEKTPMEEIFPYQDSEEDKK